MILLLVLFVGLRPLKTELTVSNSCAVMLFLLPDWKNKMNHFHKMFLQKALICAVSWSYLHTLMDSSQTSLA